MQIGYQLVAEAFGPKELVRAYRRGGGDGPRYAEVPVAWAPDEEQAVQAAGRTSRWAVTGWKVMSELPNPVNFDTASATVTADDIGRSPPLAPTWRRTRVSVRWGDVAAPRPACRRCR